MFNNRLYALSTKLYQLKNNTFDNEWKFKNVTWAPDDILYINTTLDNKNLFIKTTNSCYLYNNKLSFKTIHRSIDKRVYGQDKDTFIDFKHNCCKIYLYDKKVKKIDHVRAAAIDKHHNLFLVNTNDEYSNVKIIYGQPYYLH